MATTPEQRARLAAHASWANTPDPAARTAPARSALDARFEREVDPDGVLSSAERARRAEHARKAHFARLALLSSQARRRRATAPEQSGGVGRVSPPDERRAPADHREGPPENQAAAKPLIPPQGSAADRPGAVTTLPVSSLLAALDHLDRFGLCACWVAGRRCPRGRWSR